MIDQISFRSCQEYREILRILQKASDLQDNILWQSLAVGKNIVKIHHFEIDFVTRGLQVYFDGTTSKLFLFSLNSIIDLAFLKRQSSSVHKIQSHSSFPKK